MGKISKVIEKLYAQYTQYPYISTDSRNIMPNSIFFALQGQHFDGNAFAAQALSQGAVYSVIDNKQYQQDERYILVDDVLTALQELAHMHRQQLKIPIIAITGSNGKTTTKELLHRVLSQQYQVYATQGNLNNHLGVPLSLLAIGQADEMAIIEMGANHQGEIAKLCQIARPTHGLITNLGHAHLKGFGGFEGVVLGKGELYDSLYMHHGQVFINATSARLIELGKRFKEPIYYPQQQAGHVCELLKADPYVVYKHNKGSIITTQLLGKHQFENIAAALCVGQYFGIDAHNANQAIQSYKPANNRSQVLYKGTNTILLDAYNASPESMQEAIQALQLIRASHKVLILGDMNELGQESAYWHEKLVKLTTQYNDQEVILHGPNMEAALKHNSQALYFSQKKDLATYLQQRSFKDTAILIKGSRSLELETLLTAIRA